MQRAIDKRRIFSRELADVLEERSRLTQERASTQDPEKDRALSDRIEEINSKRLPDFRKQIHNAFNAAKGTEKHLLSELIRRIDDALIGIGMFRDIDVSDARLNFLSRRQGNVRSHREGKDVAREIGAIKHARLMLKKQQEALIEDQQRRNQMEAEIQRIDAILYGHLNPDSATNLNITI